MRNKLINFLTEDIWRIRLRDLPRAKSMLVRNSRVILLSVRGFDEDKCKLRASALTFYTLLSIVPVVALAFGIAKGFGLQEMLETHLLQNLPAQEEILIQLVTFSKSMLETAKGGLIAGIGTAILFWLVVRMLGYIERSFNDIWGVKEKRPVGRKLADYLAIMVLGPIFLITSTSIIMFITTQVELITGNVEFLGFFSPLILTSLKAMPYLLIWLLFTFLYMYMPNTRVNFSSGILAGIVAGTIYVLTQEAYLTLQIGVSRYNAIYGSFAAVPLFLIWLQISWFIVLFGAEISFAHQNVDTYEFEPDCLRLSHSFKKLLSLHIMRYIIDQFTEKESENRTCAAGISHELEIPIRLVRQILFDLENCGMVTRTCSDNDREPDYVPAKDLTGITIGDFIQKVETSGLDQLRVKNTPSLEKLGKTLENFRSIVNQASENIPLKDI